MDGKYTGFVGVKAGHGSSLSVGVFLFQLE